jgi:hypothetical protein
METTPADEYLMRAVGFTIASLSIMMLTLLNGIPSRKAVGYGGLGYTVYFACQKFITQEWEAVGMPAGKNYAWMVFFMTITATLFSLIGGPQL